MVINNARATPRVGDAIVSERRVDESAAMNIAARGGREIAWHAAVHGRRAVDLGGSETSREREHRNR